MQLIINLEIAEVRKRVLLLGDRLFCNLAYIRLMESSSTALLRFERKRDNRGEIQ